VEGNEDVEYYLPAVRRALPNTLTTEAFVCAGKANVLECYLRSKRNGWNSGRISFFVDSDLEPYCGSPTPRAPNMYKTDFYSIESDCVSEQYFDAVWTDLFHLSRADLRLPEWRQKYMRALQSLAEVLVVLFAAAIVCKRGGGDVKFDELDLKKVFKIDAAGDVTFRKPLKIGVTVLDANIRLGYKDVASTVKQLRASDYRMWFRGKFALRMALSFLRTMKVALGSRHAPAPRAVVKCQFADELGIEYVAGRNLLPASLSNFLAQMGLRAASGTSP
jgi:hypothetical protein